MSENLKLGQIITGHQERDAIHIAVVPMVAGGKYLSPGDHVAIMGGTKDTVVRADPAYGIPAIGVVDPFIRDYGIKPGERVWVLLYPGTITGLRHEWTHPAFEAAERIVSTASESELWLRAFASRWSLDYDELIDVAQNTGREWAYVIAQGIDLHSASELGDDHALFWRHLENLTGKTFDEGHREAMGWSCTC